MKRPLCFFLFFIFAIDAFAENNQKSDSLLIITPSNLANYYDQLVSPLIPLIKDQKIIVPLASGKDLDFSFSEAFQENSNKNSSIISLDNNFLPKLAENEKALYGLPFGFAAEINKEPNPQIKGYKILWNLIFAGNQEQDSLYQLTFNWFGSKALFKSAAVEYYRKNFVIPNKLALESDAEKDKNQLPLQQLEILNFKSPSIVRGYLEFSKQFFGVNVDKFWIYSTMNNGLREVPDSIRNDKILGCEISFEDLFNFSANVTKIEVTVLDEKSMLLPLTSLANYKLDFQNIHSAAANLDDSAEPVKTGLPKAKQLENTQVNYLSVKGDKQRLDNSNTFVSFNYENNKYLQLAPWAPVTLTFVPRKVWVVQILSKDPFITTGKEILYIDQETFLPFYKITYNRIGEQIKTVISSWAKAETKDQKISFFFNTMNLAIDNSKQTACVTITDAVQTFQGKENQKTKELWELIKLENYKKEEKPKAKAKK